MFRENSAVPSKATLEERLKEYPELKAKIEAMLGIIEKAAEAERRIIEELRQMGNEVLQGWARRQQDKKELEYNAKPGVNRKEKNLFWYTRLGKIEIGGLHPRPSRDGDTTLFCIGGSGVPWVFGKVYSEP